MKLKSILCNDLLASSRYCDGTDGRLLLDKYSAVEFDTYEKWDSLSCMWGYTEMPSNLCELFAYSASRRITHKLAIEILFRLHYPNLQCVALAWVKDPEDMCNLAFELTNESRDTVSIFLSIIEVWNWRLNRIVDNKVDKGTWMKKEAPVYIRKMYNVVLKLGYGKLFSRWLFNKGYRDWKDIRGLQSEEKQLFYLLEAAIVYSWDASLVDSEFYNIDYLTYLATDVDENHPLATDYANKVLEGYVWLFDNLNLPAMILPLSDNMLNRLYGFSEMFWKVNRPYLYKVVIEWIEKYECIFEGWRVKGKSHDYRHVQRETFLLSALLEMCIHRIKDIELRTSVCSEIVDHLFRQHNCVDNIWLEYYSAPFCIFREAFSTISTDALNTYDERLIKSHRNICCVLNAINCSGKISISAANKELLRDRWKHEHKVWEGRLITTGQKSEYDFMIKMVDAFTQP